MAKGLDFRADKDLDKTTRVLFVQPQCAEKGSNGSSDWQRPGGVTELKPETLIRVPRLFRVILLNDDFTPMEFVVGMLKKHFLKKQAEAEKIMLDVHEKGAGVAGIYPLEIAEMKVMKVTQEARREQHPLKLVLEEESS